MTETAGEAPPAPPAPVCYRHPDRETYIRCTRCEKPICPQCMIPAAVGHQCPSCVHEGAKSVRTPRTVLGAHTVTGTPVTWALVAVNVVLFAATGLGSSSDRLFNRLILVPAYVDHANGLPGQWYRLVSAMFLHLSVIHILFNMWALVVMGLTLEPVLGRWRFLALYLVGGLGGSVASYLFAAPLVGEAGASGAVFALFSAAVVIARRYGGTIQPLLWTIGLNLVITFSIPGISKSAHLGGLVTGAALAAALVAIPNGPRRTAVHAGLFAAALVVMAVLVTTHHVALPTVQLPAGSA